MINELKQIINILMDIEWAPVNKGAIVTMAQWDNTISLLLSVVPEEVRFFNRQDRVILSVKTRGNKTVLISVPKKPPQKARRVELVNGIINIYMQEDKKD